MKKTYGIKNRTEIEFKIHAEGKQNNKKKTKESKNRGGLIPVKAALFAYKQIKTIDMLWQQGNQR